MTEGRFPFPCKRYPGIRHSEYSAERCCYAVCAEPHPSRGGVLCTLDPGHDGDHVDADNWLAGQWRSADA